MGKLYESTRWIDGLCYKFGNIKCYPMFSSYTGGKFKLYTFEKIDKLKVQVGNKSRVIYFKEAAKIKLIGTFKREIFDNVDTVFDDNIIPFWVSYRKFMYFERNKEEVNELFHALFV